MYTSDSLAYKDRYNNKGLIEIKAIKDKLNSKRNVYDLSPKSGLFNI